jgi:hypothetical protein
MIGETRTRSRRLTRPRKRQSAVRASASNIVASDKCSDFSSKEIVERGALEVGCATWSIPYAVQEVAPQLFPSRRGAVGRRLLTWEWHVISSHADMLAQCTRTVSSAYLLTLHFPPLEIFLTPSGFRVTLVVDPSICAQRRATYILCLLLPQSVCRQTRICKPNLRSPCFRLPNPHDMTEPLHTYLLHSLGKLHSYCVCARLY